MPVLKFENYERYKRTNGDLSNFIIDWKPSGDSKSVRVVTPINLEANYTIFFRSGC